MASPSSSSNPGSLDKVKEFHANFMNNEIYDKHNSDIGQLKLPGNTVVFPWATQQVSGLTSHAKVASAHPQKEKVTMSGPQSEENVQDLKAMNEIKQRDILYDESQKSNSGSANLSNLMDVHVQGKPSKEEQHYNDLDSLGNIDPETLVDNALNSDSQNNMGARRSPGNYMNIDVSGITVSAINTVEGGSAVATSNIIINPVQVIDGSSQASEKI